MHYSFCVCLAQLKYYNKKYIPKRNEINNKILIYNKIVIKLQFT